jgi:hypothetical protein
VTQLVEVNDSAHDTVFIPVFGNAVGKEGSDFLDIGVHQIGALHLQLIHGKSFYQILVALRYVSGGFG